LYLATTASTSSADWKSVSENTPGPVQAAVRRAARSRGWTYSELWAVVHKHAYEIADASTG
jgi:hypothetical protein